ncbi:MAG: hypothetical protein Kow0092_12750 [Deferrisomatales bacterium]
MGGIYCGKRDGGPNPPRISLHSPPMRLDSVRIWSSPPTSLATIPQVRQAPSQPLNANGQAPPDGNPCFRMDTTLANAVPPQNKVFTLANPPVGKAVAPVASRGTVPHR